MYVVIGEAELELVPRKLWKNREVLSYARRRKKPVKKLLLESSFMPKAVKELKEGYRRGRPDIAHRCLLTVLDSIANKLGLIEKIYLHTRHNLWFEVKPETRLPRNYMRFLGLMEQLLEKKRVPPEGEPLMFEVSEPELKEPIALLHENGELWEPGKFTEFDGTLIVGAFPHGDFNILEGRKVKICDHQLSAFAALYHVLSWKVLKSL